jgi:FkbM family methyltransferase
MTALLRRLLSISVIARLPVRVLSGIAKGARWSLFPWSAYWRGTHEPEVQSRLLQEGDWTGKHIWDLGSHYGIFTIGLGRLVGPAGSVAAFEPNPLSYERLQLHVRRNRLSWVKTFPFAVSDSMGSQRFFLYEGLETTSSHLAFEGETWNETIPTIQVNSRRLDDMVAAGEIDLPDFIKLDVEGHGHKALAGAKAAIAKSRPKFLIGFHSVPEIEGVLAVLEPLGYRCTPILPSAPATPSTGFDYFFEPLP